MPTAKPPRLTEYVVGYRSWVFRQAPGGPLRLGSILARYSWTPGTNVADCMLRRGRPAGQAALPIQIDDSSRIASIRAAHDDRAADPRCECGLYAYHDLRRRPLASLSVRGAIRAWGRIQVHATGFRAEYAEIVAFADNPAWHAFRIYAEGLLASYGVPIVNETDLPVVAAEYGSPVPKNLRPPHPSLR